MEVKQRKSITTAEKSTWKLVTLTSLKISELIVAWIREILETLVWKRAKIATFVEFSELTELYFRYFNKTFLTRTLTLYITDKSV